MQKLAWPLIYHNILLFILCHKHFVSIGMHSSFLLKDLLLWYGTHTNKKHLWEMFGTTIAM